MTEHDSAAPAQANTSAANTWAVHFPCNLRWTNAMQIVKGMVPYAAVAMDEVEHVGRRLKARAAEADLDRVWREEWAARAERVAAVADTAAAERRHITAGHHYMRAILLQRRALHPARRGEDGDVSQGTARLSRGDGAPLSRVIFAG